MINFEKAFVDTAPFIYFIEKDNNNPQYYKSSVLQSMKWNKNIKKKHQWI